MTQTVEPPRQLVLVFCPVCGRNDRFTALRERLPHNTPAGRRCDGRPVRVTYVKGAS